MKYYLAEDGITKIPLLTKGWKARWLVGGLFFGVGAIIIAFFLYRIKFPNLPTLKKIAIIWSLWGILVRIACVLILLLLIIINSGAMV